MHDRPVPQNWFRWENAVQRITCLVALPVLGLGIYLSVRLAIADVRFTENTPASLSEAVRLEGGNAAYHDLLAEHIESMGKNPDPERDIAVRLSPLESSHWIGRGVRAEVEGDYSGAEKYLLEAARVNRGFDPRWALMNFYFRRGNTRQFAVWAQQALEINYGDPAPLFRLCWLAASDPRQVEDMLPARREVQAQYLGYLGGNGQLAYGQAVAKKLAAQAEADDLQALLNYCDGILPEDPDAALAVWNTLCRRKLEPFAELAPEQGRTVTNGDFARPASGNGFDWRVPRQEGVFVTFRNPGVSLEMTGNEPVECVLLTQPVPLTPGRRYRLDYEYRGDESDVESGLRWELTTGAGNALLARSDDLSMKGDWITGHVEFTAGAANAGRLSLQYRRASGTVRHQGVVAFRRVAIEPVR